MTFTFGRFLFFAALCFGVTASSIAETDVEKGLAIATEVDRRDIGFGDSQNSLSMLLKDQHGNQQERLMRNRTLEQTNDGDKSIIVFDNPGNVKGTAFLSWTHKTASDDQWLFLPALKKTKRITSNNKAGAFMNSEFAYEDISSQEVEKFTYRYLRDDTYNEMPCFVLERIPVDKDSGYSKQEVWIDQVEYRMWKTDYYDRAGQLKKTLSLSGYQQYLGKYWRAQDWQMVNHQTGKNTELRMTEWKFQNGFTDSDFNTNSLERIR